MSAAPFTAEQLADLLRTSCEASGVPLKVTEPRLLATVAQIVNGRPAPRVADAA
jgi:hypothetical protein